ncbi:rRNA (cytosine-C(5))-methyltransferase NOP2C [Impatiens glandulifera]|uniref:rRNA (cytosine-C(5))-methyltransferase NOP2C n=1 Tax=Impatiens glandulifera TaxID=253017 RepID=UPI001FB0869A|nr:rRNA (cytosine-C(5))-methyltransferase NOP2C [Impatiens glandulifera]
MKKAREIFKLASRRRSFNPSTISQRNISSKMDPSERYSFNPVLNWDPQVNDYFVKAYGADHFSRISKALTCPSSYSCIRVNTLKSTSDAVIEKLLGILQERVPQNAGDDIQLNMKCDADVKLNEVPLDEKMSTNSTVASDMDVSSEYFGNGEIKMPVLHDNSIYKCPIPGLDYVVFVKGSGPHTIDYGHEDKPFKEMIVSRKCAEAVLRGAQVYVPGVLACSAHLEKGDVVAVSVAIEQPGNNGGWGIPMTRGTVLPGLETDPYYFERHGLYIGQGTSMVSRVGLFRALEGIAVDMTNKVFKLPSFNNVLEGEVFLQNLPSIIAAHALDPQQGERILDMCAAPGGKTTAICILMKDKGEIVAADRSHNKVLDIQKLAAEMDLHCITTCKLDALKATCRIKESCDTVTSGQEKQPTSTREVDCGKNNSTLKNGRGRSHDVGARVEKSSGFPPNSFDRVLLDAPCSALGLRPRLFAGVETIESLRNHAKYQRKMFDQAVQLARPGGVIVYSTCTINPGENEALVRYALDTFKFLSLAPQHPRVGGPGLVGGCQMPDGTQEEWLRAGEEELVQRFDPSSPLDTIGFFIAKFSVGPKDAVANSTAKESTV